jgi:membrane-bound lytic murein transglycosylase B
MLPSALLPARAALLTISTRISSAFAPARLSAAGTVPDVLDVAVLLAFLSLLGQPPPPDQPIPREPAALAGALTATTRELRGEIEAWGGAGATPEAVTLHALYQQRMYRLIARKRALGDAVLARLPDDVRGEARDTVRARRALLAIPPSGTLRPRIRAGEPEPAERLRAHYARAQRRFGVGWHVLAAVNFVETGFGRLRNMSTAGARGPMQFIPATWRAYGLGGDVNDPRDAILGAANYLHANGAPRDYRRALFHYNHSSHYVDAVLHYARRIRRDERAFYAYYAWQVYVRRDGRVRRITGP